MSKEVFVGIDVGGTHITISVANKDDLSIIKTFSDETKSYASLAEPLEPVMAYLKSINAEVIACCAGGGGPLVSSSEIHLTNAHFIVSKKELQHCLQCKKVLLVNDFMLLGYALLADEKPFKKLTPDKEPKEGAKLIIGVGTGLGKCIIVDCVEQDCTVVVPSEGGHRDYSMQSELDREICDFIKLQTKKHTVSYEDILSGNGIKLLHEFFEGNRVDTKKVFMSSEKTLSYFAHVLGQFAKNSALDSVAIGGVYFAGGILIAHPNIFEQESFQKSFVASNQHLDLLSLIPHYLLEEYKRSAYGACYAASLLVKHDKS